MASFYAELEVGGHTYPVRNCSFDSTQATNERGRVAAKVRHGLLHLTLDVPDDAVLLDWGTAANKPLDGHVTFFETDRRTARETVSFTAGACVGYHELFASGKGAAGAYVCQLTIAAAKLVLTPGGPPRPLAMATPRDYVTKQAATPSPVSVLDSDCSELLRQQLQNKVKQNCKSGKQSCLITDDCPALEATMQTLNACIAARTKINMTCFKGGDAGHQEQIVHKINGLVKCQGYYFSKCNKKPQPAPVRHPSPSTKPVSLPAIPKEVPLTIAGAGLFILYLLSGALRPGPI
jgi:hypothetical protein